MLYYNEDVKLNRRRLKEMEIVKEELDYRKAIIAEDKKIGLKERQKNVVAVIEKEFGVGLTNSKEGGTEKMANKKGGVKQNTKTKVDNLRKLLKVVPPGEVDLETVKLKAMSLLEEVEKAADFGNIKYELEKVNIGILNFKQNSRLIFGVRYAVCGDKVSYSLVTKETFKYFSKELHGKYAPGNWNVLFDLNNSDDIKKFTPIIEASIEKIKKTELPRDKVKKE
ncbi:hypothetical protein ES705_07691 [subsurface metagenome]